MWKSSPKRVIHCKMPGLVSYYATPVESVWECPRCGDLWKKEAVFPELGDTRMTPLDPRSWDGCGTWSCDCGPHEEQLLEVVTQGDYFPSLDIDVAAYPLLCMKHRRHLPCRSCK